MKFTIRAVGALTANSARDSYYWCDDVTGFGIRIKPNGTSSYMLQYRTSAGVSRRLTLGKVNVLTPNEARKLAKERLAEVAKGNDPANERSAERHRISVKELCAEYIKAAQTGAIIGKKGLKKKRSYILDKCRK